MPRLTAARRDARREEVLAAAVRCFARTGYQQTSMADIIAESGMSAGAIYGYVTSKKELIHEVAARTLAARRQELVTAGADAALSPAEIVAVIARGLDRDAPLTAVVQVWGEATVDAEIRELLLSALGELREAIVAELTRWAAEHPERTGADPAGWACRVAPVLVSMLPGFTLQRVMMPGFDPDAFLTALPELLPGAGSTDAPPSAERGRVP